MTFTLVALSLLVIVATLLPLLRHDWWWIRVFDFPRGQITVLGVLVGGLCFYAWESMGFGRAALVTLLLASVVYQGYQMLPYSPLVPKQVLSAPTNDPTTRVALLISNVLLSNRNSTKLIELIRAGQPDVVFTVETDAWWESQLRDLEKQYPFVVKKPQDDTYGMLLYSRFPLLNPEVKFLREKHIPSIHAGLQLPSGARVQLHGLHPAPPYPRYASDTTQRDAELLVVGKQVRSTQEPTIVVGDLNDVAWSYTTRLFQKMSGLLDPRIGRGSYNTFHVRYPIVRFPLDHVFVSHHFKLIRLERLPDIGSDHFPVFALLKYDPKAVQEQQQPQADPEEVEEAEAKIDAANRQLVERRQRAATVRHATPPSSPISQKA